MTGNPANLLTIFGATGDLAQRMLLPSLYGLQRDGLLPKDLRILGTARSELDAQGYGQYEALFKETAATRETPSAGGSAGSR